MGVMFQNIVYNSLNVKGSFLLACRYIGMLTVKKKSTLCHAQFFVDAQNYRNRGTICYINSCLNYIDAC